VEALAQKAEYIWCDGTQATGAKGMLHNEMRSKTKVYSNPIPVGGEFHDWWFDGSSTGQAEAQDSDCILRPVFSCPDPIRGEQSVLVLCEVLRADGAPHRCNTRAQLEAAMDLAVEQEAPLFGFEQEYTLLAESGRVLGWPAEGTPAAQGPYYCGVGAEAAFGRTLAEAHLDACVRAGLTISGMNAETMPGQWEFQIGPGGAFEMPDHVMVARWLLHRIAEDMQVSVSFDPKPVHGDWNGAGAHTNFSTTSMRRPGGMGAIEDAISKLKKRHSIHIAQYGAGNDRRMTGLHKTCDMGEFKWGVADREASIRIPRAVAIAGYGYLEDRRPAANADPYTVARLLIETCVK